MALIKLTPVLRHSDAIGYLKDFARDIGELWFEMICDLAAANVSNLDHQDLEVLLALYKTNASYLKAKPQAALTPLAPSSSSTDFLEELSGFDNFKLLASTLRVIFQKRITLIFGANGSGKSSLCECLKALATPETPIRPLYNVRATGTTTPAFSYKFKSDVAMHTWTETAGYGTRRETIKYFDTGIAIRNVKNPVEPGRLIELTPFKLHVFELAMGLTTEFRESLQNAVQKESLELTASLQTMRAEAARFKRFPWTSNDETALLFLPKAIKMGEIFTGGNILNEKRKALVELEKTTSHQGLKLLKAEHHELETFLGSLGNLLNSAHQLWAIDAARKARTLAAKKTEQEVIGKTLVPKGGNLESLLKLLHAAEPLCKFDAAAGHTCPLCKRELQTPEIDLFRWYHELLVGEVEKDITDLSTEIKRAEVLVRTIHNLNREEWEKSTTIPPGLLATAKAGSDTIVENCGLNEEPTTEATRVLEALKASSLTWTQQLKLKATAIQAAASDEQLKQLELARAQIDSLEYFEFLAEQLDRLKEIQRIANEVKVERARLLKFTPLQRRITEKTKQAYEKLIVGDFEDRLNAEYISLTEKDIGTLGVKLRRIGDVATVTIAPEIGDKGIESVLSEGEQRIHALALFFAELETCSQSVLVFDDPISSFDYNYIANFCVRLRDFVIAHPTRQVIVLTHNWEFFVQLQTTLNKAALNWQLAIQILENCSEVSEYSEEVDQLKSEIAAILSMPGEPSKKLKEELAFRLRRLIEAVVNTHAFNKQRHQYKQKSQTVSEFQHFTKLVRLLPAEATTLRDLFEVLSVPEHSDPRNAYVNTDKATFQARYDRIIAVEDALISRK